MAPTLSNETGIRRDSDRDVTLPAALPEGLERPTSAALPRTVAGRQRTARLRRQSPHWRLDWAEMGTLGLVVASAVLSVYRLFWAIGL